MQLRLNGTSYEVRAGVVNDSAAWTDTSWYTIPDAWTAVEIDWQSFPVDGSLSLWLDGALKQTLKRVVNGNQSLDSVRLGAQGIETGTRGTLRFDDFEARRLSSIGLLPDPGLDEPEPVAPASWQSADYEYDPARPHAVTFVTRGEDEDTFTYDPNGNMDCRVENGRTFKQENNAENRIEFVKRMDGDCATGTAAETWQYYYDGDGTRVAERYSSGETVVVRRYYFGGVYETHGGDLGVSSTLRYYGLGGQKVAMNDGTGLQYFLNDHLGSFAAVTDSLGALVSEQRYLPFGGVRTITGSPLITQTDFGYTGQRNLGSIGLMDYNARFYSPALGRFIQPDSIVPGIMSSSWNRYTYVNNSPIKYNDPSGHHPICSDGHYDLGGCHNYSGIDKCELNPADPQCYPVYYPAQDTVSAVNGGYTKMTYRRGLNQAPAPLTEKEPEAYVGGGYGSAGGFAPPPQPGAPPASPGETVVNAADAVTTAAQEYCYDSGQGENCANEPPTSGFMDFTLRTYPEINPSKI